MEIWEIVAFLRHLDALSADEEKALQKEGESDDHHEAARAGAPPKS
jgi:hypothetical protein